MSAPQLDSSIVLTSNSILTDLQDAAYLETEDHARDFKHHLAMFATRAHLAHQQKNMSRKQLNELLIKVWTCGCG